MQQDDMVCQNCLIFNAGNCHEETIPFPLETAGLDPSTHWCSRGLWSDRENNQHYTWGTWDED